MQSPLSAAALAVAGAIERGAVLSSSSSSTTPYYLPNGCQVAAQTQAAPCPGGSRAACSVFLEVPEGIMAVVKRVYARVRVLDVWAHCRSASYICSRTTDVLAARWSQCCKWNTIYHHMGCRLCPTKRIK